MASSVSEQLVKYLTDVHAMEVQALAQMRAAPERAGDIETAHVARRILEEERAAAEKLYGTFESALDASLEAVLT
jgi:ferritin-like metal-binding protein YciE